MSQLFGLLFLCACMKKVQSVEQNGVARLFDSRMCLKLCQYEENHLTCYIKITNNSTDDSSVGLGIGNSEEEKQFVQKIKSKLKGLVTFKVQTEQSTSKSKPSRSFSEYVAQTNEHVYHLSIPGPNITKLVWEKKPKRKNIDIACDSNQMFWVYNKSHIAVGRVELDRVAFKCYIMAGPSLNLNNMLLRDVDMASYIMIYKRKQTFQRLCINANQLEKRKELARGVSDMYCQVDKQRRHIYYRTNFKLIRVDYTGNVLKKFSVKYGNIRLDFQGEKILFYDCIDYKLATYEMNVSAWKRIAYVRIRGMNCFDVWKIGRITYVEHKKRLRAVRHNKLGKRLGNLKGVSGIMPLN